MVILKCYHYMMYTYDVWRHVLKIIRMYPDDWPSWVSQWLPCKIIVLPISQPLSDLIYLSVKTYIFWVKNVLKLTSHTMECAASLGNKALRLLVIYMGFGKYVRQGKQGRWWPIAYFIPDGNNNWCWIKIWFGENAKE